MNGESVDMPTVGIIKIGTSNLHSVVRAVTKSGWSVSTISVPSDAGDQFDCIVLPGVGNFGYVMGKLEDSGLASWIRREQVSGTPILGICLGAQLLFESSEESPGVAGFGFLAGTVKAISAQDSNRVPHMGWNLVSFHPGAPVYATGGSHRSFYFAHSYHIVPRSDDDILALTRHGSDICAVAGNRQSLAIQFHPEKSGRPGQEFLERCLEWIRPRR